MVLQSVPSDAQSTQAQQASHMSASELPQQASSGLWTQTTTTHLYPPVPLVSCWLRVLLSAKDTCAIPKRQPLPSSRIPRGFLPEVVASLDGEVASTRQVTWSVMIPMVRL